MARYEHLPIYKQAMDVAVHFEKVVAGFSRYHKYTLGTELRNKSREIVAQIIRANAERDKAPKLIELRGQLDEQFILIRLAKEVQAFKSFSAYQFTVEQVACLGCGGPSTDSIRVAWASWSAHRLRNSAVLKVRPRIAGPFLSHGVPSKMRELCSAPFSGVVPVPTVR